MKIELTHNDIQEISRITANIIARYIKAARGNPIPAESIEGIIEQGLQGWVQGRTERDKLSALPDTEYNEPQPTDTVYGC